MVAREHFTGRVIRLWRDELLRLRHAPFDVGPDVLVLAYVAQAEMACFRALGWPLPMNREAERAAPLRGGDGITRSPTACDIELITMSQATMQSALRSAKMTTNVFKPLAIAVVLTALTLPALARETLSDADVASAIIRECAAIYHASRPCACPEDRARNGSRCGGRSAYVRPGGAMPRCYPRDVSAREIADYRIGKKSFVADCEPAP